MDFIKAVSIIKKDLEEARALLDQLSATPGTYIAEIELARSRVRSATELLALLPRLKEEPEAKAKAEVEDEAEVKAKEFREINETVRAKIPESLKAILADRFSDSGRLGEKVTSVR
ncbi:MAG: hypothetical protein IH593_12865, partial [Bacteroidales bacterium]|nr:hypothetical protein [Bacteroidales bacterium]